jgi:hypothetical protein
MKKRGWKFLLLAAFLSLIFAAAGLRLTSPSLTDLPPLKDGDIVFQTSRSNQSLAIMAASGSPYSHMGFIRLDAQDGPVVIETGAQVRETPLQQWIDRGVGRRVVIKRITGLTTTQANNALQWAKKVYGKPYDLFFLEDDAAFYCSELVYDAFREGAGISIGKMEKAGTLKLDTSAARALIEKRWQKHPLCTASKASTADQCFEIIKSQHLVTPGSILNDSKLETIYSNYGF